MQPNLPNFLIIGAMKCATSTLHEQLARQPGIFMSEPKEPNYFSNDEIYARGPAYYAGLFAAAGSAQLRGESSTHYTKLPTYPKTLMRMQALLPRLKLIYVMRHPIDRLVSQYIHEWSQRDITLALEPAVERHPHLVEYGLYCTQLAPYFDAYGKQNVLPVFLERLQSNPQEELERVCSFLGYAGTPRWVDDVQRQNVSSERLRLGRFGRELFDHPQLAKVRRAVIPQFLRDVAKQKLTMRERPQLSARTQAKLVARYDADLAQLGRALGTPQLCCANFKTQVSPQAFDWVA